MRRLDGGIGAVVAASLWSVAPSALLGRWLSPSAATLRCLLLGRLLLRGSGLLLWLLPLSLRLLPSLVPGAWALLLWWSLLLRWCGVLRRVDRHGAESAVQRGGSVHRGDEVLDVRTDARLGSGVEVALELLDGIAANREEFAVDFGGVREQCFSQGDCLSFVFVQQKRPDRNDLVSVFLVPLARQLEVWL